MITGAVFAIGAFFALTFGLIAAVAAFMPDNPWRWAIGAGAIFLLYAIVGGILGWMGYKEVTTEGLAPQRTLRVIKLDLFWIQNEARSA
jgi:membrane protein implicated in regulation of membrane protease activity